MLLFLSRPRPALLAAAIATTLLVPMLTACGSDSKAKAAKEAPVIELAASDLTTVQSGDIEQTLRANGTLYALHESLIRAKVGGDVTSVAVQEGEHVTEGQELARIDDLEYRARLDDRRAALEAGRAQAALAEATRGRNEELLQKKYLSSLTYDNSKSAAAVAHAQVESLEAQIKLAEKALRDATIRAPISGWIAERAIQRGDKATPEGRLFTIVDLSRLEMKALVPANEAARLAVGQPFKARVEGYGEHEFTGRVARVGAQALSGSRAVPLYIEFANPDAALKAGLFAEGRLTLAHSAAQALIPLTALRSELGKDFVYVIDGKNTIRRTPVGVGMKNETTGQAEILHGLGAGQRIVAINLGPLREGATIRISSAATSTPVSALKPSPTPQTATDTAADTEPPLPPPQTSSRDR